MSLRARMTGIAAIALSAAALLAGCSGSSSDSSGSARIRAVNLVPNGGTATILINAGAANGTQDFDQSSSYLYIDGGISSFYYSLSAADTLTPASVVSTLNNGSSYTLALVGRADVPVGDTRLAKVVLLNDDHTNIPSGSALLRVMNAAPDTSTISVTLGSTVLSSELSYSVSTGYLVLPSGTQNFSYKIGSATFTVPNINLKSGSSYSLFVTEPVVSSATTPVATFSTLLLNDDH